MKNPGHHVIADFKEGNKEAFAGVYNMYYHRLYYFIKRMLNEDRQQAEDIVADTFVKLWNRRENFETHQNIKAFLFITARNACLDYLRYQQRQHLNNQSLKYLQEQEVDFTISNDDIKVELLKKVHREIESLPPKCQQIFKLSFLQGLKNNEIAEQLDLTLQTVKNQKVRAIKILRLAFTNMDMVLLALVVFLVSI